MEDSKILQLERSQGGPITPDASAGLNDGATGVSLFKQGANGEPFPGFDVDIGANQSTHGPFHPVNL